MDRSMQLIGRLFAASFALSVAPIAAHAQAASQISPAQMAALPVLGAPRPWEMGMQPAFSPVKARHDRAQSTWCW